LKIFKTKDTQVSGLENSFQNKMITSSHILKSYKELAKNWHFSVGSLTSSSIYFLRTAVPIKMGSLIFFKKEEAAA